MKRFWKTNILFMLFIIGIGIVIATLYLGYFFFEEIGLIAIMCIFLIPLIWLICNEITKK